jgi:NAD(P)-dependent dehydrogenase (short-subunit alcohol dehydrogenase family)
MRLSGKRAVITGAASGMGREGALLFAREGARVFAVDVDADALKCLREESRADILSHVADLSRVEDVRRMVAGSLAALGGVDIFWSHAGVNGPTDIEDLDSALYERTLSLNITASVVACGEIAPAMRRGGGGSIVLTSSVAGLVGSIQSPVYSATKFALVGFAKSLALRLAPDGVRVNAICPGPIDSPMLRALAEGDDNGRAVADRLLAAIPMGRFGAPREVAEAALWLASEASSFVTGIALPVDGGVTAR